MVDHDKIIDRETGIFRKLKLKKGGKLIGFPAGNGDYKMITGFYIGDGTVVRDVNLPFDPKHIIITCTFTAPNPPYDRSVQRYEKNVGMQGDTPSWTHILDAIVPNPPSVPFFDWITLGTGKFIVAQQINNLGQRYNYTVLG